MQMMMPVFILDDDGQPRMDHANKPIRISWRVQWQIRDKVRPRIVFTQLIAGRGEEGKHNEIL